MGPQIESEADSFWSGRRWVCQELGWSVDPLTRSRRSVQAVLFLEVKEHDKYSNDKVGNDSVMGDVAKHYAQRQLVGRNSDGAVNHPTSGINAVRG